MHLQFCTLTVSGFRIGAVDAAWVVLRHVRHAQTSEATIDNSANPKNQRISQASKQQLVFQLFNTGRIYSVCVCVCIY